jgi:hypothetical protein
MLRGAPRFSCVLRGALCFFDIYNITYQKKKKHNRGPRYFIGKKETL